MNIWTLIGNLTGTFRNFNLKYDAFPTFEAVLERALPKNMTLTPVCEVIIRKMCSEAANKCSRGYWGLHIESERVNYNKLLEVLIEKREDTPKNDELLPALVGSTDLRGALGLEHCYFDGDGWVIDF